MTCLVFFLLTATLLDGTKQDLFNLFVNLYFLKLYLQVCLFARDEIDFWKECLHCSVVRFKVCPVKVQDDSFLLSLFECKVMLLLGYVCHLFLNFLLNFLILAAER